jgi:hypothetical protein
MIIVYLEVAEVIAPILHSSFPQGRHDKEDSGSLRTQGEAQECTAQSLHVQVSQIEPSKSTGHLLYVKCDRT